MFINEQQGTQMWTTMLKENFNVTDAEKLNWVSQYAAIHEIHESMLGLGGAATVANSAVNAVNTPVTGVNPIYATPLNTTGMGNPMAPGYGADGQVPMGGSAAFFKAAAGSGDIPVSTLPMALNVALLTIGLELLPVIPAKAPWALLSYMDFPYAGGKLGRGNEVANLDGRGDNAPLYIKLVGAGAREIVGNATPGTSIKFQNAENNPTTFLEVSFTQWGRMDGQPIVKVVSKVADKSVRQAVADATKVVVGAADPADKPAETDVDFAQTSVDFIDGYANFATGAKAPMTRAENETGTGNVIGLRLFSKWIQMGSYEVTGTVTRQQLQDLPIYGVDAVAKVMEALQNEITQSINARILEHVFALGTTNAVNQYKYQHVNLNLRIGANASFTDVRDKYVDIYGHTHYATGDILDNVPNSEVATSAENLHTRQRRLASRLLAAANLIQTVGRRGRATWAVMSGLLASALQDCSGYVVAPMANNLAQDGSQNLFLNGTLAGLKIYVDPYMDWNDTRICVGRKGNGNEPGAIFMPYILADTVSITAEGTMAPKMLVNSRYAIADAGFFPETQYYTFCAANEYGWI